MKCFVISLGKLMNIFLNIKLKTVPLDMTNLLTDATACRGADGLASWLLVGLLLVSCCFENSQTRVLIARPY